jgi:hypothetical protein
MPATSEQKPPLPESLDSLYHGMGLSGARRYGTERGA